MALDTPGCPKRAVNDNEGWAEPRDDVGEWAAGVNPIGVAEGEWKGVV